MKQWLAELIIPLGDILYVIIKSVPLGVVRALVFAIIAALTFWVLCMPPQLPEADDGKPQSMLGDLRFFAVVVLALQAVLYIIF